jgi:large subunit ribosomal protein L13Ae
MDQKKNTMRFQKRTDMACRLEERRKVKGAAYYERKKAARRQLAEATKTAVGKNTKKELAKYGY